MFKVCSPVKINSTKLISTKRFARCLFSPQGFLTPFNARPLLGQSPYGLRAVGEEEGRGWGAREEKAEKLCMQLSMGFLVFCWNSKG